jgi:hypothetical protein
MAVTVAVASFFLPSASVYLTEQQEQEQKNGTEQKTWKNRTGKQNQK